MISPADNYRIYLASRPVDFRKGMDGLAAYVVHHFDLDPFCGAIFVFRSRRADRLVAASPADIAQAVLLLLSADYIAGEILLSDGELNLT